MNDYPDFTVIARLKGEYAGAEKSVVLDNDGRMMALIYGIDGTPTQVPIKVDSSGRLMAQMYADDGTPVAVDGSGRLKAVMVGTDGTPTEVNVLVDGSGRMMAQLYGSDGTAVAVDGSGHLAALLYGTHSGANKKIEVDVDGNVRMNLYAQDLAEMTSRFKYGAPTYSYNGAVLPIQGYNTLYDITGKGYVYHLDIAVGANASHNTDFIRITMDGEVFTPMTFKGLNDYNYYERENFYIFLKAYDTINFVYRVCGIQGFTFESSLEIEYNRTVADSPSVARTLVYALI